MSPSLVSMLLSMYLKLGPSIFHYVQEIHASSNREQRDQWNKMKGQVSGFYLPGDPWDLGKMGTTHMTRTTPIIRKDKVKKSHVPVPCTQKMPLQGDIN